MLSSIFQFFSFFGGFNFHFGGSDHSHRRDTPKGADIVMDLDVTLEELYSGEFIEVFRLHQFKSTYCNNF